MADLTLPGGLPGYLATPAGDGPWPAVVVVHEIFGLTADMRHQADRMAEEGYLTFAPDLFSRGPRLRCVLGAFRDLFARRGRVFDDVETARSALADREDCTGRVGVIGFCMGGGFALVAAALYDFDVASVNYGDVPRDPEEVLKGACPVVAGYGSRDLTMRGRAARLERTLTVLDVPHDVREYKGAGHSFLSEYETGPALKALRRVAGITHDPEVAADAWQRIFTFFDRYLRNGSTT
jgi:carboxymethylenebutenolidase